jgi:hypothetical protein
MTKKLLEEAEQARQERVRDLDRLEKEGRRLARLAQVRHDSKLRHYPISGGVLISFFARECEH